MSHRRIHSKGNVPFSWEEKPGVPKSNRHQKSSSDHTCLKIQPVYDPMVGISYVHPQHKNIAPPPPAQNACTLKSCSKSSVDEYSNKGKNKYCGGKSSSNNNNISSVFSCKYSCDIVVVQNDDDVFSFSKLPPIPKQRYSSKSFVNYTPC
ncbi:hypothetical protein MIMGU_mgv1a015674mg [Erythranthe guttata]|uniref:Uncharacterized protein n=1 Tax=Erythranthe guttata TaxID=4155 RepID=A0A022RZX7_ERYGU|nr:hypothetical protein MIMGU_mgv1a015674mg [Erythranthe guttata]